MSEKYKTLPPMQVVVPIGFQGHKTNEQIKRFCDDARRGLALAYLEYANTAWARWREVDRVFVVREEQSDILTERILDARYRRVVMPNEHSYFASDRREFIRTKIPFPNKHTIRMVMDADVYDIGTNVHAEDKWCNTPVDFSRYIGPLILTFLQDRAQHGVTFAGFNDRENRPSTCAGIYPGFIEANGLAQYGRGYFKEPLTFETEDCPGAYPSGWDFKEGAYRILDTYRKGGKTVRYLPTVHSKTRKAHIYEGEAEVKKLVKEFGKDVVLRRPPHGLNLGASGLKRNKLRVGGIR